MGAATLFANALAMGAVPARAQAATPIRLAMVEKGQSRGYINESIHRLRRVFILADNRCFWAKQGQPLKAQIDRSLEKTAVGVHPPFVALALGIRET